MPNSFIIGLTGGIGSGKSLASDYFHSLGITIVDADVAARTVVQPGSKALSTISKYFGSNILLKSGALDRKQLREIIFNDSNKKTWLEALLHPLIAKQIIDDLECSSSPYTILVSPLLFETKQSLLSHRVLVIDTSESLQLERSIKRDQSDKQSIKAIINSQMDRSKRNHQADDVVVNDGDKQSLYTKLNKLHQQYLKFAST